MLHRIHEMYHILFTQYVIDANVLCEYLMQYQKSNVSLTNLNLYILILVFDYDTKKI